MNFISSSSFRTFQLTTRIATKHFIKDTHLSTSSSPPSASYITASLKILSLNKNFTIRELRDAYFDAAKQCHPDTLSAKEEDSDNLKTQASNQFLQITEAYEALQIYANHGRQDNTKELDLDFIITKTDEEYYREAVYETLGIDADVLEESKKCPMFRIWLKGGSHTAFHYNMFLMRHGGLAQMLPAKKAAQISEGPTRRRRKR